MISIIIPTLLKCEENLYRLLDTLIIDDSVNEIIIINNALKIRAESFCGMDCDILIYPCLYKRFWCAKFEKFIYMKKG